MVWRFLKKLGMKSPYDPAISLLSIYPEETKIEKDTCTPRFTVAPFTIASTWKQLNYPLTEERIKMWCIDTLEYDSAMKKSEITPCGATRTGLDTVIHTE